MVIIIIVISLILIFKLFSNWRDRKLLETVTKIYRGTRSERNVVLKLLKHGIPAKIIFHDLYVENDGQYSQIDLVIVTNLGILVIEVKEYSGWLFGKGNQKEWTQVLAYGREKNRFYNPVKQNNGHIIALRKLLNQSDEIPFYSIIVFYGGCELKDISLIPNDTFIIYSNELLKTVDKILDTSNPLEFIDKWNIINLLVEAVQNGESSEIKQKHIENIRNIKNGKY